MKKKATRHSKQGLTEKLYYIRPNTKRLKKKKQKKKQHEKYFKPSKLELLSRIYFRYLHDHRMVSVGRVPWVHLPQPQLQQGYPEQLPKQLLKITPSPVQPVPVLHHL